MPEYELIVDKYVSMGYPIDKAEDYATPRLDGGST